MARPSAVPKTKGRRRLPEKQASPLRSIRNLAYVEVASTELAREINRDIVLELIRAHQPIARVDLVRHSGLQNSTVSSIVEQLLQEGWIREGEAVKTARGRRPTQISLNDQFAMLVADVRPGRAELAVVDLHGRIFARRTETLPADPAHGVETLAKALLQLRDAHPKHTFEGAGLCLPGRIDPTSHRLVVAPNLRWENVPVEETLAPRLGMQVELENDANACLLSELWFGHLDGVRNAVLLAISEGVGASLLAEGQLINGGGGMAGEFGHVCYDPQGPVCGCGRRGCWEVFASSTAALRAYTAAQPESTSMAYDELVRRALSGEKAALAALETQAVAIGRGLRMVVASLSPDVIIFAGEVTLGWSLLEPILRRECAANLLAGDPPTLLCAGDGGTAHLLGAAAVVLQRHTGFYRSRTPAKATAGEAKGAPRRRAVTASATPARSAHAEATR